MINKKVLTILIMSLMFTLLVGCSSVKEYSYDYNKISEMPKEIGSLINLQYFSCSSNQISEIPKEIGYLINLQ